MEEDIHLAFWLSKVSCNLMVEKIEKSYVFRFFSFPLRSPTSSLVYSY